MSEPTLIKTCIIYIIEHNTLPNYRYIGKTVKELKFRWGIHKQTAKKYDKMFFRLGFFINYYDGIENFNIKEYKTYNNITEKELDEEEKKYINELGSLNSQNANELITINITNEMRNELIKKFINNNVNIVNLYKLIDTFNYTHYKRERTDFQLDDINDKLLTELLKTTLFNNLVNTKVLALDYNDEGEIPDDNYYTLTETFINDELIIDDYIKYIEFFNKQFEITNNKDDIYYYNDLIYGLKLYGEYNDLFDFYLLNDFEKILQHYFNILNNTFDNVNINYDKKQIIGIRKINNLSFNFSTYIYNFIKYYIEKINYKTDKNYNPKFNMNKKNKNRCNKYDSEILNIVLFDNCSIDEKYIENNKLYISKLQNILYPMCYDLLIHNGYNEDIDPYIENKYNTDNEYIYDLLELDKIINDKCKLLSVFNNILTFYDNEYKIVNDIHIIVNKDI
jgi:hypothetical protein